MRSSVLALTALVLSIAFLGSVQAGAAVAPGYYGSTSAGGELNFGAKFNRKGKPTVVKNLRWANIPIACAGYPPLTHSNKLKLSMKVNRRGKFRGSGKLSTGASVAIAGKFKRRFSKATGTFRIKGTIAGCQSSDTGKLDWKATRKP